MATLPTFSAQVLNAVYSYFAVMGYEEGFSDLTSSDIAKTLEVAPKAVNAALARLNADSLVELEEWDGNGKTQNFVHITEAGRNYINETSKTRAAEAIYRANQKALKDAAAERQAADVDKEALRKAAKNERARRRRAVKKAAQA